MTLIEQLLGRLDDRGDDPRPAHDSARRAHRPVPHLARDVADRERELGRPRKRVAPRVHRGRPRVSRLAAPREPSGPSSTPYVPSTTPSGSPIDSSTGPCSMCDSRYAAALASLSPRRRGALERDPESAERLRQPDPVAILELRELGLIGHRPGRRRRAEERTPEARPLLVGPADQANRHARLTLRRDPAEHFDARHHVQAPVEPAPVRNRVHVPADQQRLVGTPGQREPLVAGLVDLLARSGRSNGGAEELTRPRPRLRPRDALRPVFRRP